MDKLYWRDTSGNTIAETDSNGNTTNANYNEYVFFAGQRIAQSNPFTGSQYYYVADHLGSTRVVTNASGSPCYEADFLPYGNENTPGSFTNSCSTNYKFTGYERDPETNNDYAFARYYSSREERFLSPDPLSGDISDPQTLNKYTYSRNNPTNITDPSGLCEDPAVGCSGLGGGCELFCVDPGPGGGNNKDGPQLPVYHPPAPGTETSSSEGSSGDPWVFGCESNGMPCGMQFPGGRPNLGSLIILNDIGDTLGGCTTNGEGAATPVTCTGGTDITVTGYPVPGDSAGSIGKVIDGLHKIEQPFILLLPVAAGVTSGLFHYSLIVPVVAGGCLDPTPAEPLTCGASLFAAGDLAVVGTGSFVASYVYLKKYGLPGLNQWWNGY